jgi:hypothetical protein
MSGNIGGPVAFPCLLAGGGLTLFRPGSNPVVQAKIAKSRPSQRLDRSLLSVFDFGIEIFDTHDIEF